MRVVIVVQYAFTSRTRSLFKVPIRPTDVVILYMALSANKLSIHVYPVGAVLDSFE